MNEPFHPEETRPKIERHKPNFIHEAREISITQSGPHSSDFKITSSVSGLMIRWHEMVS